MAFREYVLRKLIAGVFLILGVTFISFLLIVYFGPPIEDIVGGKNQTAEERERIREAYGVNDPFLVRYGTFLKELATLDFGRSIRRKQDVNAQLADTIPVSLSVTMPGFVLGNALGLLLAMVAARYRGGWLDRTIMAASVVGMSISLLIVVIVTQIALSSEYGLNMFPTRGWRVRDFGDYLQYATVPTIAIVIVALGYNTRFYRAILVEELSRDHVRTARAYGASPSRVMTHHVLKNAAIPIITRILFTIPLVVVSGSLVIENYFGIPGVGKLTFDALQNADQPILKAVVSLTAVLFVLIGIAADLMYRAVDPRVTLS